MASGDKLHIVMFPWLAFGHIIPFLELSKFLAEKGNKISFVSTNRIIDRLPKIPESLTSFVDLVKLSLPVVDHLGVGEEATMDIKAEDMEYLKKAFDGLEPELSRFLESEKPDWVIYDFAPHWLPRVASKLGISRGYFCIMNAWFASYIGPSWELVFSGEDPRKEPRDWTVPPEWVKFPTNVAYRSFEARWVIQSHQENVTGLSDSCRSGLVIGGSDAIFVRQCFEFEPEWLKLLEELHHRTVIPIGLMPPTVHDSSDDDNHPISEWLNRRSKNSVVYIALGSEVNLSQLELTELALGIEQSGLPFIWALRKKASSSESDNIDLPVGFLERVEGRGLVWTSWAPQLKILSHDSVGGFLTHCGWSSCIEGLTFGKPCIMLPFVVDQGLNARVLVKKKVGVEVPRNEDDGYFTRHSVAESLRAVMVEDEGDIYRKNSEKMSKVVSDKDLHDQYLEKFVEFLVANRSIRDVERFQ